MVLQKTTAPRWVYLVVLLGILLSIAGAVIAMMKPAMLVGPETAVGSAAHIFAGYFAARSIVIAAILTVLLAFSAHRALGQMLVLVGFIQLVDGLIDCSEGRWPIVPGVSILGVLFLLAAAKLCGHAFWRRAAWVDEP